MNTLLVGVKGTVHSKNGSSVILEINGFLIKILCDIETLEKARIGQTVQLHTHLEFSQEGITIYGFLSKERLYVFEKILKVSKIGPKTALRIVSTSEPEELVHLIISKDVEKLSRFPGIGKKTAERLIAELKDEEFEIKSDYSKELSDAIDALVALGFGKIESREAAKSVYHSSKKAEQIVKEALKILSKKV